MARVRGTLVVNTFAFVRKVHGPDAHARILKAIGPEDASALEASAREAGWFPLHPLLRYIEKAREMYAPGDADYFRSMGRFAGTADRESRAMGVMVSDLETATKMARVLWRQFFDEGRLEVVEQTAQGARLRILDFEAHPALCERIVGSLEGLLGGATPEVRVVQSACALHGAAYCEYELSFGGA